MTTRTQITCLKPQHCGAKWHWSDSTPECGASADAAKSRRALGGLAAPAPFSSTYGAPARRPATGEGLHLEADEASMLALENASAAVHGLRVNRHALAEVIECVSAGTLDVNEVRSDADLALAYEVLCLDADVQEAVVRLTVQGADGDEGVFGPALKSFRGALSSPRGVETPDQATDTLDDFPYTKQRLAGVLDAAYEAQKRHHAHDAMVTDVTGRLYRMFPDKIAKKWIVRGNTVQEYAAKAVRAGDTIISMGQREGSFDVERAEGVLTDDEWAAARAATPDGEISIPADDLKREAKAQEVDIDPFHDQATTEVKIMVSLGEETDADAPFGKSSNESAKAAGLADYAHGRSLNGSRYYVPDLAEVDDDRAFATLVRARARADMRKNESGEIAEVLKATIRGVEAVAMNHTIRYEDSARDFAFQSNQKRNFDRDLFSTFHPEIEKSLKAKARVSGVTPSEAAVTAQVRARYGDGDDASLERALSALHKTPSNTPRLSVAVESGGKVRNVAPSATGKAIAAERIASGQALNGRVLTEALAAAE